MKERLTFCNLFDNSSIHQTSKFLHKLGYWKPASGRDPGLNAPVEPTTTAPEKEVTQVFQVKNCQQVLLMTCLVLVLAPDGSTSQVSAQLDSASSALFITERLTQRVRLLLRHHGIKVTGIGGAMSELTVRRTAQCGITCVRQQGKVINVEALVFPKSLLICHRILFLSLTNGNICSTWRWRIWTSEPRPPPQSRHFWSRNA